MYLKWRSHCADTTGIGGRNDWRDGSRGIYCKTVSEGADVTFCGRVLQSREVATGKAGSQLLKDICIRLQAMLTKQSGDVKGPRIRRERTSMSIIFRFIIGFQLLRTLHNICCRLS